MDRIEHWFYAAWPILSPVSSFALGAIFTRWALIPRFCPECTRRREWTAQMQKELRIQVERESRLQKESNSGKPKSGDPGKAL